MRLRFEAQAEELARVVDFVLGPFRTRFDGQSDYCFQLSYQKVPEEYPLPPEVRTVWSGDLPEGIHLTYCFAETSRFFDLRGMARCYVDLRCRRVEVLVKPGTEWSLPSACLIPALSEIFRDAGHHLLHAATLLYKNESGGDQAILLAGATGRGKTSTALALAHSGMEILSDDISFVAEGRGGPSPCRLWGILPVVKIRRPTLELLPWLNELPHRAAPLPNELYIEAADVGNKARPVLAPPAIILFMDRRSGDDHQIEPLDKVTALGLLLKENVSAVDRRGDGPAGRAVKAMTQLVGSCGTFTLSASPNLETLYERLMPLLSRT